MLLFLVSNRVVRNQGASIFRKRYVRFPVAMCTAGLATYAMNVMLLKPLLYKEFKEAGLDKYYELDLNAEMMKKDLADLGINIQAANFNLDEAQKRVNETKIWFFAQLTEAIWNTALVIKKKKEVWSKRMKAT